MLSLAVNNNNDQDKIENDWDLRKDKWKINAEPLRSESSMSKIINKSINASTQTDLTLLSSLWKQIPNSNEINHYSENISTISLSSKTLNGSISSKSSNTDPNSNAASANVRNYRKKFQPKQNINNNRYNNVKNRTNQLNQFTGRLNRIQSKSMTQLR